MRFLFRCHRFLWWDKYWCVSIYCILVTIVPHQSMVFLQPVLNGVGELQLWHIVFNLSLKMNLPLLHSILLVLVLYKLQVHELLRPRFLTHYAWHLLNQTFLNLFLLYNTKVPLCFPDLLKMAFVLVFHNQRIVVLLLERYRPPHWVAILLIRLLLMR